MNYLLMCSKCKKKTLHSVAKINVKRGIKLICTECMNERKYYINYKNLEELEVNENNTPNK